MALTPIDEALSQILSDVIPLTQSINLPLEDLDARVLAEDVFAQIDVPPWDNSAMDGYAVCADNISENTLLNVSQTVYAGYCPKPLELGSCVRIYTGAPMPEGADSVVMQEDVEIEDGGVRFKKSVQYTEHVRPRGQDIKSGQLLFKRGHQLKSADLSVLAAVGLLSASVLRKPRVAIISTGDELVEPGNDLKHGQIYNSNRILLNALLRNIGCDVVEMGVIKDSLEDTVKALTSAARKADLILSSGGVSVGDADYLKQALEIVGHIRLWKMAIKPGKPLVYGRVDNTPYFGLPGNPSSAFVTFTTIVMPYVGAFLSRADTSIKRYAKTDFSWSKPGTRQEYLRVQVYNDGPELRVKQFSNQSSGIVLSLAWANALAIIPIGAAFEKDTVIEILPLLH